jgi:integrase
LLALGIRLKVVWIPTEWNPADEPSRRFQYSPPPHLSFGPEYSSDDEGDGPGLVADSVCTGTFAAYKEAITIFQDWLIENKLSFPSDDLLLDRMLVKYFDEMYVTSKGKHRQIAVNTVAALKFASPRLKAHLQLAERALKGWERRKPSKPHPPFTWDLTTVLALSLWYQGRWKMAIALLLSFECYLRIGELGKIKRKHISDVGDPRCPDSQTMLISLPDTKTGKNQWVTVRHPLVVLAVRFLLSKIRKSRNARLFSFEPYVYRYHLKRTCRALGLTAKYVPHSARHGGATKDHILGESVEDIMLRGRWASSLSTRRYIQMGRALLLDTTIPPLVASLFKIAPLRLESFLTLPQNH